VIVLGRVAMFFPNFAELPEKTTLDFGENDMYPPTA